METLGERITRTRKARKLSQVDLARLSHCAQSTISMLENDERTERPDLIMIAHALGVDAYWLKTGHETIISGDLKIHETVKLMETMSAVGREIAAFKAREIAKEYPDTKQKAA